MKLTECLEVQYCEAIFSFPSSQSVVVFDSDWITMITNAEHINWSGGGYVLFQMQNTF